MHGNGRTLTFLWLGSSYKTLIKHCRSYLNFPYRYFSEDIRKRNNISELIPIDISHRTSEREIRYLSLPYRYFSDKTLVIVSCLIQLQYFLSTYMMGWTAKTGAGSRGIGSREQRDWEQGAGVGTWAGAGSKGEGAGSKGAGAGRQYPPVHPLIYEDHKVRILFYICNSN